MKKLSRNQWIGVFTTFLVGVIFYTTGNAFGFFNNQSRQESGQVRGEQIEISNQDQTNTSQNMDQASANASADTPLSSSVGGLEITDLVVGTGKEAVAGKVLAVHYTGALTDGRVFDSSVTRGVPFEFTLGAGQVIPGWEKGFAGMKVGGKRQLVIPSDFAYGPNGVPGVIPPNATLVFEVELLEVK